MELKKLVLNYLTFNYHVLVERQYIEVASRVMITMVPGRLIQTIKCYDYEADSIDDLLYLIRDLKKVFNLSVREVQAILIEWCQKYSKDYFNFDVWWHPYEEYLIHEERKEIQSNCH